MWRKSYNITSHKCQKRKREKDDWQWNEGLIRVKRINKKYVITVIVDEICSWKICRCIWNISLCVENCRYTTNLTMDLFMPMLYRNNMQSLKVKTGLSVGNMLLAWNFLFFLLLFNQFICLQNSAHILSFRSVFFSSITNFHG